jgi:hypothetical protein
LKVVESAATAARPKQAAGARPASEAPQLGALALAQLSGALRLVSAEAQSDVERYADPQLIAAGKIHVISLEAIQQHFGDSWQGRKEEVFAFAQQVLKRNLGSRGIYRRVSDSDFFVLHPGLGRFASQAACLRYLREIFIQFHTDADQAASGVLQVIRATKGRLETKAVDAPDDEGPTGGEAEADGQTRVGAVNDEANLTSQLVNRSAPFISTDGRMLRVSASLEPIYELKTFTRIGFRMIRRIITVSNGEALTPREVAALPSADLVRADLATITRGIDRLKVESAGEQQLSLIVPVSFSSLASHRGRTEVVAPIREASHMVKLGVICEISDIEGVPTNALLDVTSLVRPLSLLVVGRLTNPTPSALVRLAGAGFQALSFDCPPAAIGDAEFLGWANSTVTAARKVVRSVLVYHAGSTKRAGTLASLGATHVSLDAG